jgi:hypothetical protein
VTDPTEFAAAVATALRETRFGGTQAMLIIDHRSLLFHVQDTPPAEGKMVDQMIDRLVARSHFFEEKAAWSRLALPEAKGRHRHLLSLLPESLVQSLVAVLAAHRVDLVGVFPIAAVLGDHLRQLSAQEGEVVLLAADLGDAIHLLLGLGDGQVLFSRTVAMSGQQPAERAAQEINRTLHYAQQQFGATVNKLFIYGDDAYRILKDQPIREGLSITPSPVPADPIHFARHVFLLSPKLRQNFIPPSALKRKSNQQLAAVAVVFLAASSVIATIATELTVRARERAQESQARQSSAEWEIRQQSILQQNEAGHARALLGAIGNTNDPPVPELFARHLTSVTPESARISRLDIRNATNGWHVRLEGFAPEPAREFVDLVAEMETRLTAPPFRLRIQDSTRQQLTRGTGAAQPGAPRRTTPGREPERPFFIEGTIE